uniref:Putative complement component c3 n=1 Tax=Ctenopharyngodon idella TaxID=7959 RepID=A0A3T0QHP5_CTEID|nr:putative complement component c3 [Ctenopharyngodon idella]
MDVKLLCLTVVLLSSPLLTLCDPLFVLSAPNLLRVGSSENVFVEAQDYSGGNLNVRIIVKKFPKKDKEILSKSVTLTADNNYQILTDIKIPDNQKIFDDPLEKQYVYLQAQFPTNTLEKVVMVSFQTGYIFVQTDKPIYTPASTVRYRIFCLTPNMKPLSQSGIMVEVMNPQGITVSSEKIYPVKGMAYGFYAIPEVSSTGMWKVVTRHTNTPQKTFTTDFEVKEYVLPTFEVKLIPSKSFYYVDDQSLAVDIEAKYLIGQKVDGNAIVVFGVIDGEKKTSIATSLQKVQVFVTNPDQMPAKNIEVEVNPGAVRGRTRSNGIAKVTINTLGGYSVLEITAKTKDPQLRDEQQAVKTMTALAYIPKDDSNNYLHISIDAEELQIGDHMKVYLNTGQSPGVNDQDYTYMILSKGQIVQADRFKRKEEQSLVTLSLPVTKDMVPSFRFVAYYHVGSSEGGSVLPFQREEGDQKTMTTLIPTLMRLCHVHSSLRVGFGRKFIYPLALTAFSGEMKLICALPFDSSPYSSETTSITNKLNFLRQSITTWQILAVSLSPTLGICVAEPEEIVVFKSFFIDLKMPYSAVRGEQLEIKAIIHNYTPKKQKVRVEFIETEDVCSSASKKGKHRTTVNVDKDSSIAVSYVIIPMTLGNHRIEVKAATNDSVHTDGVRKSLKVVLVKNVKLNPAKMGGGEQHVFVRAEIPSNQIIPDSPAFKYITVSGEGISQTVEQAISGDFMGRLIIKPKADGESNMIFMTLPLIATHYLDSTNQWEAVGMERRSEAISHINTVFILAIEYIALEENVICSALKWLVLNKQLADGSFKEDSAVLHKEMVGDVRGKDADASLTAFVVIAMQEGREICAGAAGSLNESIRKAVAFLERRLPHLTNPYAVAMTSYALANSDKLNKDILMKHSTQGEAGRFWTVPDQRYHSLEATAYAVLALMKAKDFDKAGEAVHWLGRQQSHYGGSGTTQATIMVFQAVAKYHTKMKNSQNFTLDMELSVAGRRPVRWTFTRDNVHVTRSYKVDINKDFNVTARGTGTATLSVFTEYYAKPVEKSDCKLFDFKMERERNEKERYIQKFEMNKVLSKQRSLILYLEKVSHKEKQIISFKMHKMYNVDSLQPAAVTIYQYNSPEARCTKFYHPDRKDGALYRLRLGEQCWRAEGNCSFQKKHWVRNHERLDKACEDDKGYAYKVTVVGMVLDKNIDIYNLKVEQVLKKGTDNCVEGLLRIFQAHPTCRESLGLQEYKSYLIMGPSTDLTLHGGRLQYIFGEQTWIEYWPTSEESQTKEYKDQHIGITELANTLGKTDKPIYTPASTVQYRIFSLTPNLKPLSQSRVTVEIMNPQGITVSSEKTDPVKGMMSRIYSIPNIASPGMWKVVTRYTNTPQKTFTTDFEVKEYVPPTFEVKLIPSKSFFYVDDRSLAVDIEAKYLFGQKIWDIIEKHDTGCTAGGGRDSMGVFSDAGLMFESSTAGGTNTRTSDNEDEYYTDLDEIMLHTLFPESWLWQEIDLCENWSFCSTCMKIVPQYLMLGLVCKNRNSIQLKCTGYFFQAFIFRLPSLSGIHTKIIKTEFSACIHSVIPPCEAISQTVEQAISGDFMGQFIVQPSGDGEQNMIHMTLPLIATHYLDRTKQWEAVGMERRNEAVNHINTGYQWQLSYRKPDGSYAALIDRPSSTWLTAYVAKVFAMAIEYIDLQENVICSALNLFICALFQGDVQGKDAEASLTAFVVIAMQEGREICAGAVHATIIVFQAVAEYRTQVKNQQNCSLDVELAVAGRSNPVRWTVKKQKSSHITRSDKVEISMDFNVTARGTGTATLSVFTLYYARPVEKSDCTFFDLTVKIEKDPETALYLHLHSYKSDKTDATMTILDIGIPTGFRVESKDLEELSTGKEKYIQKFEMDKLLSERGSLILYLDKAITKVIYTCTIIQLFHTNSFHKAQKDIKMKQMHEITIT